MRLIAQPAFVLHARPYRETSLLVDVLTADYGRLGVVARGVLGPKKHVLRAALQPLQWIRLDAVQRGELAHLAAAEALDAAPRLSSDATLAGFYVNELLLRLVPRQDPVPDLYALYGDTRERLASDAPLAWTLRRFERDLLDGLGLGFDFREDGDGAPVDPAARYLLDPEHGPRRVLHERGGERGRSATGAALLSLAADACPDADALGGLRRALRGVLQFHLGGRGLKSWELMAALGRLAPPVSPQDGASVD